MLKIFNLFQIYGKTSYEKEQNLNWFTKLGKVMCLTPWVCANIYFINFSDY